MQKCKLIHTVEEFIVLSLIYFIKLLDNVLCGDTVESQMWLLAGLCEFY